MPIKIKNGGFLSNLMSHQHLPFATEYNIISLYNFNYILLLHTYIYIYNKLIELFFFFFEDDNGWSIVTTKRKTQENTKMGKELDVACVEKVKNLNLQSSQIQIMTIATN